MHHLSGARRAAGGFSLLAFFRFVPARAGLGAFESALRGGSERARVSLLGRVSWVGLLRQDGGGIILCRCDDWFDEGFEELSNVVNEYIDFKEVKQHLE